MVSRRTYIERVQRRFTERPSCLRLHDLRGPPETFISQFLLKYTSMCWSSYCICNNARYRLTLTQKLFGLLLSDRPNRSNGTGFVVYHSRNNSLRQTYVYRITRMRNKLPASFKSTAPSTYFKNQSFFFLNDSFPEGLYYT